MSASTPTPTTAILASHQGFDPMTIARVFGCYVEGSESVVPMIEYLWGRELTPEEIYEIGKNDELRVELEHQLPNLPLDDWRDTESATVWEGWAVAIDGTVVLCPIANID